MGRKGHEEFIEDDPSQIKRFRDDMWTRQDWLWEIGLELGAASPMALGAASKPYSASCRRPVRPLGYMRFVGAAKADGTRVSLYKYKSKLL